LNILKKNISVVKNQSQKNEKSYTNFKNAENKVSDMKRTFQKKIKQEALVEIKQRNLAEEIKKEKVVA
jgi:hypothetical protein